MKLFLVRGESWPQLASGIDTPRTLPHISAQGIEGRRLLSPLVKGESVPRRAENLSWDT